VADQREEFDVVIIGAGVAGALIAANLAASEHSVLILEAGPQLESRAELIKAYATADRRTPGSPYQRFSAPRPDGEDDYYRYAEGSPEHFKSGYERVVGGSTWHWLGSVPRLVPADFEMQRRYRVGIDWPISYDDLEPWYHLAEQELGVSGNHDQLQGLLGARRSQPFPMSEVWPSYSDLLVERRLRGRQFEGVPLAVRRTPQARNSQPYQGRPPCAGNSSCVPLCPIGAKYDATVHIARACAAKRPARLRPMCMVTRLIAGEDGRIRIVEYQTRDGQHCEARGQAVVLSAHAIESARLLLFSGLANSSDQVGRNLMDHANRFGSIRATVPMFPFRGPPTTSGIDDFRDGSFRSDTAAFRLSLGNDGAGRNTPPERAVLEQAVGADFGQAFRRRLRDRVQSLFRVSCLTEMLPSAENRVSLADERDAWGVPLPMISFAVGDYTRRAFAHADRVMGAIFDSVGHVGEPVFEAEGKWSGAGHIMGTCRMGDASATSVVDANCSSHDHPNLFIAGSSVFPTSGTANPTLTVAALALRLASHLDGWLERERRTRSNP
jgi:choline dehydrogenase-like flavoprotein